MAERCCSQFPLFTTSRTKLAVRRRREWPGAKCRRHLARRMSTRPERFRRAKETSSGARNGCAAELELRKCAGFLWPQQSRKESSGHVACMGLGPPAVPGGSFRNVGTPSPLDEFGAYVLLAGSLRMQVPCTLSGPPQIGQTLLSLAKNFCLFPIAGYLKVCYANHGL